MPVLLWARICARLRVRAGACVREAAHICLCMAYACVGAHACACGCVRACVRGCVCACMLACEYIRMYDHCIILLLWSAVALWQNAGLAIEREVFESPLIPFRSLGILFLFTMPQFTRLYK